MKSLPLMICLSLFLIFTSPGWAEDGDYKSMILEFEKFRSTYPSDLLQKEPSRPGFKNLDLVLQTKPWNQES